MNAAIGVVWLAMVLAGGAGFQAIDAIAVGAGDGVGLGLGDGVGLGLGDGVGLGLGDGVGLGVICFSESRAAKFDRISGAQPAEIIAARPRE